MKLRIAVLLFSMFGGSAQAQSDEDLVRSWSYYDAYRINQASYIHAKHEIHSVAAELERRRAAFQRAQRLVRTRAISEEDYQRRLMEFGVAQASLKKAQALLTTHKLAVDVSELRWKWHRGEERDIGELEKLQFALWQAQCEVVEVEVPVKNYQQVFANWRLQMIRNLVARNVENRESLEIAVADATRADNELRASKEVYQQCKNGPPFDPMAIQE